MKSKIELLVETRFGCVSLSFRTVRMFSTCAELHNSLGKQEGDSGSVAVCMENVNFQP